MALTETNEGLWFREDLYADIACGFRVSAVLHRERSAFQDILILDTPALGKVLVLDGIVQCAEKDEAIYHEMLAHSGVLLRQTVTPTSDIDVLVVGGGDGGIARECLKHASVARVTVVDIDPRVRETVLASFPALPAGAYADVRVTAVDADAAEFVRGRGERFDLIVADTPDPVGTALPLFDRDFVADCHAALKDGGVFIRQAGSLLLQAEEFRQTRADVAAVFGEARTRTGLLANCTYLGGWFGWLAAVKNAAYPEGEGALQIMHMLFEPVKKDVRWYSPEVQAASQVLTSGHFVSAFLAVHHDKAFRAVYAGLARKSGDLQLGIGVGNAWYNQIRHPTLNPWLFYATNVVDFYLMAEYYFRESAAPWFYKGYATRRLSDRFSLGKVCTSGAKAA